MKRTALLLLVVGCAQVAAPTVDAPAPVATAPLVYPPAPKSYVVEVLHGVSVADTYRPLEDVDSAETRAWVEAENALTFDWLGRIPERGPLLDRLKTLWNYERWGVPRREGGRLFVAKNDGLQNQAVLYVIDADGAPPRVLLDPNAASKDGTVALSTWSPSRDGKLLAYAMSVAGSDWADIRVRDVATGADLPDVVKWVKNSGATWVPDGAGFYYGRYDPPKPGAELTQKNEFHKLCFHKLGADSATDPIVYERKDHRDWHFGAAPTEDGRFLLVEIAQSTSRKSRAMIADVGAGGVAGAFRDLFPEFDASHEFIDNDGRTFWFLTDRDAPRGRIVAVDVDHPEPAAWKTLVPESAETLTSASVVGDHFVCSYLADAHSVVKSFALDGRFERDVALPGIGSARGFEGRRSDKETYFAFTGYLSPSSVGRYDVATGETSVFRAAQTAFDASPYVTEQVFFASKDGTRVPMFLTHRRDLAKDGSHPTYLYGYGGFDISMTPSFSPWTALWLEMGGTYAVANLRGGGEYGEAWHEAGTRAKKQNVFDDFVAAAEWLIAQGFTSTPKLAIAGGSNGGLLVGACMTQRPDLFGACLPAVGVMDMLRFHKFTVGGSWRSDYGDPDVAADFDVLRRYSPYHNLKPASYPPTLVTTADHDDRVVPGHSFKFAAALQAAQQGAAPCLIRVQTKAGHGAGKPTSKILEEQADAAAFLVRSLGIALPSEFGGK
jgi:prolyl oligopeptidase